MPVDRAQLTQILDWLSVLATTHPDPQRRSGAHALAARLSTGRRGLAAAAAACYASDATPTVTLSTLNCRDIIAALNDARELLDPLDQREVDLMTIALDLAIPYAAV